MSWIIEGDYNSENTKQTTKNEVKWSLHKWKRRAKSGPSCFSLAQWSGWEYPKFRIAPLWPSPSLPSWLLALCIALISASSCTFILVIVVFFSATPKWNVRPSYSSYCIFIHPPCVWCWCMRFLINHVYMHAIFVVVFSMWSPRPDPSTYS